MTTSGTEPFPIKDQATARGWVWLLGLLACYWIGFGALGLKEAVTIGFARRDMPLVGITFLLLLMFFSLFTIIGRGWAQKALCVQVLLVTFYAVAVCFAHVSQHVFRAELWFMVFTAVFGVLTSASTAHLFTKSRIEPVPMDLGRLKRHPLITTAVGVFLVGAFAMFIRSGLPSSPPPTAQQQMAGVFQLALPNGFTNVTNDMYSYWSMDGGGTVYLQILAGEKSDVTNLLRNVRERNATVFDTPSRYDHNASSHLPWWHPEQHGLATVFSLETNITENFLTVSAEIFETPTNCLLYLHFRKNPRD